ncbi:DUF1310 family protein [Ligilactobacillus sp. LYQ135]
MKKRTKITLIVVGAFVALIAIVGVSNVRKVKPMSEKEEMIKIAKEHQKEMDEAVRYGDKDHHIKSITYEWDTVKKNPMGGFMLNGYVNDDRNLDFGMALRSDDGGKNIYCYEYTCANKLDEWTGDEDK